MGVLNKQFGEPMSAKEQDGTAQFKREIEQMEASPDT